jgi:hypothetical protein
MHCAIRAAAIGVFFVTSAPSGERFAEISSRPNVAVKSWAIAQELSRASLGTKLRYSDGSPIPGATVDINWIQEAHGGPL